MTISAEKLIVAKYNGDGSTTAFTFAFRAFTATDIVVSRRSTAGVESVLVLNTDYTVAINGTGIGGTVTCTRALAVGEVLAISRNVKMTQLLDLENQGAFFAEDHEGEFDKLTAIAQDIADREERSLRVEVTDSRTPAQVLSDVFTARDTAVQKASEASASAAHAAATAASFDSHVVQKTTEFDSHASSKTSEFDSNASTKTTAFNTNASTKTIAFDSHATRQTNLFDGHVLDQINGLNLHVARTAASITGVADESRINVSKAQTWAEGVDSTLITTNTGVVIATSNNVDLATRTEIEILGGTHSSKGWAQLSEAAKTAAETAQSAAESAQSSAESASSTATTKASEAAASATSAATTAANFDTHAAEKTSEFDANASSKTSAFDSNASSKVSDYNANATTKTSAFDNNATSKTNSFDSNALDKTVEFYRNANDRTVEFDIRAWTKKNELSAYDSSSSSSARKSQTWAEGLDSQELQTNTGVPLATSENVDIWTQNEISILGGTHSSRVWAQSAASTVSGFDSHAAEKQTDFDSNASSKTTDFNTNAAVKKAEVDALVDEAETWAEGTDEEVTVLGGEHSARGWAEISIASQADWTEAQSGSTSYIRHKPVIDTETSASSTNAVTNAAVTARINEIWSWIYNQSGWSPILATTSGVDLMSSSNEVILADHA